MKNLSLIINAVLAIAVGVLFFLHFRDCKTSSPKASASTTSGPPGTVIAYVDLDSMEANYGYYKERKAQFEAEQKVLENTLMAGQEALQREYAAFQQKAPTMTQSEGEAAQQSLMNKKNALEQQRDNGAQTMQNEMTQFTAELYAKIDSVLQDYNKDHKYAYVLSFQKGGAILYRDKGLDITADVVATLNKQTPAKK